MGFPLNAHGYQEVKAANPGEFVKLPPDGYVCTVVNAEAVYSKKGAPMLVLFLDITEGDFKGYFADLTKRSKQFRPDLRWDNCGVYRQMLYTNDDKASPFFKGLLSLFIADNSNVKINFDDFEPVSLIGAQLGFVFAEEESDYNGKVTVKVVPKFPKHIADIREGNFKVPELKRKPAQDAPAKDYDDFGGTPIDPKDTPF